VGGPASTWRALQAATESLSQTTRLLTEVDVRQPSLLPGWSRAHVLSHLAGNAEGGTRLLEGVISGIPGWEYRDLDSRALDIETGSHQPVDVLVARFEATAERFNDACAKVQPRQWATSVSWTIGHQNATREVVTLRLFEVEIHHVDLDMGRTLDDWPDALLVAVFDVVVEAFNARAEFPPMTLRLSDHPDNPTLGNGEPSLDIAGCRADVLTWLLGRSDGHSLRVSGRRDLPALPDLY
jgi:maleylpyruvate isomerase